MTAIEEITDAVILNNPEAVQGNLVRLGELHPQQPQVSSADLKAFIVERFENCESKEEAVNFLSAVLDVQPIPGNPGYSVIERYEINSVVQHEEKQAGAITVLPFTLNFIILMKGLAVLAAFGLVLLIFKKLLR